MITYSPGGWRGALGKNIQLPVQLGSIAMRGLSTLIYTEFRLVMREPAAVFFTVVFPLTLLFIFGSIFGNDPQPEFDGWGNMDVSVQGYVALIIGTATLIGIPVTIASYREQGVLKRMRATPLHPLAVIVAHTVVSGMLSGIGTVLLLVAGKIVFDLRMPLNPFGTTFAWLLGFVSFATFGFILGGVFPTARTAQAVGSAIYFPQMFLSGASGIPRELFSDTLRRVTEPLPMTQIVNLVGGLWRGDGWSPVATVTLLGIGAASTMIATKVFRWE